MRAEGIGAVVGVVIGLVIAVIILMVCNQNKKVKTEYDERQKELNGRAYTSGFYAMVASGVIFALLDMLGITFGFSLFSACTAVIMIGISVMGCYRIWNGSYWGLNNNKRRYIIVCVVTGILNLLLAVMAIANHEMIRDGVLDLPFLNLMVVIMMASLGGTYLVSTLVRGKEEEEE